MQDEKTSFWNLINKKHIKIPKIQRDYAQGREDKVDLRKKFLDQLHEALTVEGQNITLDFVYGTSNDDTFFPLDGQQRLTTIWLIHWYCLLNHNKYYNDTIKGNLRILSKFSYETRQSSKDFLEKLTDEDNFKALRKSYNKNNTPDKNWNIATLIQSQTWFFSMWKNDPTVKGLLRTLSGSFNEEGKSNLDGIEQLFKDEELWSKITVPIRDANTNEESFKIQFYVHELDKVKEADDLYIKMNSRGEQLTDLENLKADFFDELRKRDNEELKRLLDIKLEDCILKKWDTEWSDLFWEIGKKVIDTREPVDELFMVFIKRYIMNYVLIQVTKKDVQVQKKNLPGIESLVVEDFFYFNDENLPYNSFDRYRKYMSDSEWITKFYKVLNLLTTNKGIDKGTEIIDKCIKDNPLLHKEGYNFLPSYKDEEKTTCSIGPITVNGRGIFFGICKYLELNETIEEKSFSQWIRLVTNLVYNPDLPTIHDLFARCCYLDDLANYIFNNPIIDVYERFLSFYSSSESQKHKQAHQEEEVYKIKIIREHQEYEENIKKCESLSIFKGQIRCLLAQEAENDEDSFIDKYDDLKAFFEGKDLVMSEQVIEEDGTVTENIVEEDKQEDNYEKKNIWLLMRSIIAQDSFKLEQREAMEFHDKHFKRRTTLNVQQIDNNKKGVRDEFRALLKDWEKGSEEKFVNFLQKRIDDYEYEDDQPWKYPLVKMEQLWSWSNSMKLSYQDEGYLWYSGIQKRKNAVIPLNKLAEKLIYSDINVIQENNLSFKYNESEGNWKYGELSFDSI